MPVELIALNLLCQHMSIWLYSDGSPPTALNRLWLNWVDDKQLPTRAEITRAVADYKASQKPARTNTSGKAHCPHCGICHTSEESCSTSKARINHRMT